MRFVSRAFLVIAILAMGAYLLGFWSLGDLRIGNWRSSQPTTGPVDTRTAGDRLDRLGEQAGDVMQTVDGFVSDAGLSGKIKSKMALDEVVRARSIEVSTTDGIVTLTGTVRSAAERDQAIRLAHDTTGVTRVVDRMVVLP